MLSGARARTNLKNLATRQPTDTKKRGHTARGRLSDPRILVGSEIF